MSKKIAVYLDRDGVINDNEKFVNKKEDFIFFQNSIKAIKLLNDKKIPTIVVTNQGGIELGYLTEDDMNDITDYMIKQLKKFKAKVDAVYFCGSNNPLDYYRKPNPGMIIESAKKHKLTEHKKYMIGDRVTDIVAGKKSNCTTILVRTGMGKNEEKNKIKSLIQTPDYICNNLLDAVKLIFELEKI